MAPPKKKPRTTLVQKTAEEGQALLKEMGFSEQDTPGRRSTRASAKGIVYTPPPKRERKPSTPSSGEAKRRGRPRKAKVASASLDESEEAMEVSEQEDKEDAVEPKDKSQKEESDSKENNSKAKVSPKKASVSTKALATPPQVKQTKESLQKAIDKQIKPAASQKTVEQPKSTSPLKIPDKPKVTTSPQKVPEQPKSASPLKLIEQPKTVPQKDKPVSLPQKTAELAKLASTHPPKAPDSKPITISSSKDAAEKPSHKTSPESSADKLPNIQHAVKSSQSTTTPPNSKNISLSPTAVVVPPPPLPSYSPYSTKPATTTQSSNVIIVPPKPNMSSPVDTLAGNVPLSKVPLPTYSPTKPATAVTSNVFSKSNEADKTSAAPRVSHHSISPPKTASSLPGGGGAAEQPTLHGGTTPKSPPLIKADFSLNSKLSQSPPKSIFSSSPTSFSSMSKTPLFGSSSVAAKPSQVAGGASALLSQSIGAPPPSAKPASISASLGSTKPFGGSGSVPVSCPLMPPTTNSAPPPSSVVSGASSATPGSAAHPPPTVQ